MIHFVRYRFPQNIRSKDNRVRVSGLPRRHMRIVPIQNFVIRKTTNVSKRFLILVDVFTRARFDARSIREHYIAPEQRRRESYET